MTLTSGGALGIGVSPTQSLDVNGNGRFRGQNLYVGASASDTVITIYSQNSAYSEIRSNAGFNTTYNGMMIATNYNAVNSLPSWSIDLGGCINSTANSGSGILYMSEVSLFQSNFTYGSINKTGTCPYVLGDVNRNPSIDILTGTRLNFIRVSNDISANLTPTNYNVANASINAHLTGINTRLGF
jgi:hypothetical protein